MTRKMTLTPALQIAILLLFSLLPNSMRSQAGYHPYALTSGTYTALDAPSTVFSGGFDDNVSGAVSIPFGFNYNGTSYTSCYVSSNGFLTFGSAPSPTNYSPIASSEGYSGCVAALAADLTNGGSAIEYQTLGSAPNRVFVVQWKNMRRKIEGAVATGDVFNFQIRLGENGSAISIIYGNCTIMGGFSNCQVGLRGSLNSDFSLFSGFDWTNPTSLVRTTSSSNNNGIMYIDYNNRPVNGRTMTWNRPPVMTGTAAFCVGDVVAYSIPSVAGASSYTWNLSSAYTILSGQGTTAITARANQVPFSSKIEVYADNRGGAAITPTVHPIPDITVSNAADICPGGSTVLSASGAAIYIWSPTNGLSSMTGSSVTASPTVTTTYTVTGTSANGCISTPKQVTVTVRTPDLTISASQNPICSGSSTVLSMQGSYIDSFSWSPTTGLSNAYSSSPTATPSQTTTYTVNASTIFGCTISRSFTVVVNTNTVPTISEQGSTTFCPGGSVPITASQLNYDSRTISVTSPANISRNISDDFTIEYWLRTTHGSTSGLLQWYNGTGVVDAEMPGVANDFGSSILNNKIAFGVGGGTSFQDTTIMSTTTVNNFTWVHVAMTRRKSTGEMILYINGIPEAAAFGNTNSLNASSQVRIGGILGSGTNLHGNLDDVRIWNVVRTPQQIKAYMDATFPASVNNLVDNFTFDDDSATNTANIANSATFINASYETRSMWKDYGSYLWSNGETTRTIVAPAGNYTVTVPNRFGCNSTSSVKTLSHYPLPSITVANASVCPGGSTTLTAAGAISYTWSPATGLSSTTGSSVIASPSVTTTYTITGTDANGCTNTTTATVTLLPPPTLGLQASSIYRCSGDVNPTYLQATGNCNYFEWSTGAITGSGTTLAVSPTETTTYTVTGRNSNFCTATASITIYVNNPPVPVLASTAPNGYCAGGSATLSVAGYNGPAVQFDGVDDYMNVTRNITDDFTIEYWMKTSQTGNTGSDWHAGKGIVDAEVGGNTNDFGTALVGSKLGFGIGGGGTDPDTSIFSTSNVNTGEWVHVAVTRVRATGVIKIFINGVEEASGMTTNLNAMSTPNITFGRLQRGDSYFSGSIDDVRMWNVARTVNQIKSGMNYNMPGNISLIDNFTMDENSGSTLSNAATVSNSGTLQNGPTWVNRSTAANYAAYSWSNGATTATIDINAQYSTYGHYVRTTDFNGCVRTSPSITVNLIPADNIVFNHSAPTICPGATTQLSVYSSQGTTYSWAPTTGLSAPIGASVLASPAATTTYTVTAINANGCSSTNTITVFVKEMNIGVSAAQNAICIGSSTTLTASSDSQAIEYTWSPSTGLNQNYGATVTASPTVTTTYTLTAHQIATQNPCTVTRTITVEVKPLPALSATAVNPAITTGNSTVIDASGADSYTWSPATGLNTTTGASVVASPTATTTYTVTGTTNGCSTSKSVTVTVFEIGLYVYASSEVICAGSSTILGASGSDSYSWSPATGLSATTGSSITATPTVTTTYTVTGFVGGSSTTRSITITVNTPAPMAVNPAAITLCSATSTAQALTLTPVDSDAVLLNEDFNVGPNYVSPIPDWTINNTGSAGPANTWSSVHLGGGGTDWAIRANATGPSTNTTKTKLISPSLSTVGYQDFLLTFNHSYTYSFQDQVVQIDVSTDGGSTWALLKSYKGSPSNYGNFGNTAEQLSLAAYRNHSNVKLRFNYESSWFGQNFGEWRIDNVKITAVNPVAIWTPEEYLFTDAAATIPYSGQELNTVYTKAANTEYTAVMTPGTGCPVSATAIVSVVQSPAIEILSSGGVVCPGSSMMMTASGAETYVWSPAQGLNSTNGSTVFASPSETTTYTVVGTGPGGCTNTASYTVTVVPADQLQLQADAETICASGDTWLVATGGNTYSIFPTTGIVEAENGEWFVNPTETTTYTVTSEYNGCAISNSITINVVVLPTPVIEASGSLNICQGSSVTLSLPEPTVPYIFYAWSNGPVTSTINASAPGDYSVFIMNANGCSWTTDPVTVTVNPNPAIFIQASETPICPGNSVVLTANGSDTDYTWTSSNDQIVMYGPQIVVNPYISTTYTVSSTTADGCISTAEVAITVDNSLAVSAIAAEDEICIGNSTTLTATGGDSYTWSPSTGLSSTSGGTVTASPAQTTTYQVLVENNGCSSTAEVTVVVNQQPEIIASGSLVFCEGGSVTLSSSLNADSYLWSTGATASSITVTETGDYALQTTIGACSFTSGTVSVSAGSGTGLAINASSADICAGGNTTLTVSGGSNYTWSPATGLDVTSGPTVTASPAETTTYTVTSVSGACTSTGTFTVIVSDAFSVDPPTTSKCPQQDPVPLTADGGGNTISLFADNFNSGISQWTSEHYYPANSQSAWQFKQVPYVYQSFQPAAVSADGGNIAIAGVMGSPMNTVIVSPSFSTLGSNNVTLSFENFYRSSGYDADVTVDISINGGTSWQTLVNYAGTDIDLRTEQIDISAYANESDVKLRYRFVSDWGYVWMFDNVQVSSSAQGSVTWSPAASLFTDAEGTIPYTGEDMRIVYANPETTTTYTATSTSPGGCVIEAESTVTIEGLQPTIISSTASICGGGDMVLSVTGITTTPTMRATGQPAILYNTAIGDFTIEYWIKTTETGVGNGWEGNMGLIRAFGNTDVSYGSSVINGRLAFGVTNGASTTTITSISAVNTGAWTHVALTRNQSNGSLKVYINGIFEGAAISPELGQLDANTMFITPGFIGNIDELKIWNIERSAMEISANMNTILTPPPAGLTNYFQFNENVGNQALDAVNANNSLYYSAITWEPRYENYDWYLWSNGATTPGISVSAAGDYSVTVGLANGCSGTSDTFSLMVSPPVSIAVAASEEQICTGGTAMLSASGADSYTWSPAFGLSATTGSEVIASPPMTTTYTVTGTNELGCTATTEVTVVVRMVQPTVITPESATICGGASASVLLSSSVNFQELVLFQENFESSNNWTVTSESYSPAVSNWQPVNIDGNTVMMANSDAGGSGNHTNTMLTSPSFSLPDVPVAALTFTHQYAPYDDDQIVHIEISVDGGTNWSAVADYLGIAADGFAFVDLSPYVNNPDVRIRFHYDVIWGYAWQIDDVKIVTFEIQAPTWSPLAGLFTDPDATVPYLGEALPIVYALPSATTTFTSTLDLGDCGISTDTATVTVTPATAEGAISQSQAYCDASLVTGISISDYSSTILRWERSATENFANPVVINSTLPTLDVSEMGSLAETTWFRAVFSSEGCPVFSPVTSVSAGVATIWDGLAWSNGIPTSSTRVIFTGAYTATEDLWACSLEVSNNAVVIVSSGTNFNISGSVDVQSGSLTFESNAYLFQDASAVTNSNTGDIIYKRNANMRRLDYVYWGSPVAGQNLKAFSPMTVSPPVGASRFYTLSEPTNSFVSVDPLQTQFDSGKGFMVRAPNTFPANGSVSTFVGTFTGVPNNGNYTAPISHSELPSSRGFNLLGNPYPSPINATSFLMANPGTLYFWTHTNQNADSTTNYATFNLTGTTPVSGPLKPNGYIQAGQGFLLHTDVLPSGSMAGFTNAMREDSEDSQFYRSANDKDRYWLNLSNASTASFNQALIAYMDEATYNFDESYDGKLNFDGSSISSMIAGDKYMIQARAAFDVTDEVPLSFKATNDGTYTIGIEQLEGLFEGQDIFIKDMLLGITHDIKSVPYSFASLAGTFADRFSIVYQNSTLGVEPVLDTYTIVVYKENGIVRINSGLAVMNNVKVFDLRGRLIFEKNDIGSTATSLDGLVAEQQVLLVQVTSETNAKVTKKVAF